MLHPTKIVKLIKKYLKFFDIEKDRKGKNKKIMKEIKIYSMY